MKIVVPYRGISGTPCGIHRTSYHILTALIEAGHSVHVFGCAYPNPIPGTLYTPYPPTSCDMLLLANNGTIAMQACHDELQDIHRIYSNGAPVATVLYDIIPFWRHETAGAHKSYINELLYTLYVSDNIVTISHFSKFDVARVFPEYEHKIKTVPLGMFLDKGIISEYADSIRYPKIVCPLGEFDYRKKIYNIIKAVMLLDGKVVLTLIGNPHNLPTPLVKLLMEARDKKAVEIVTEADDRKLVQLYCESMGTIFLSDIEGFGLPVVESFACGTPVITNHGSSLDEVAGEAAIYTDKDDVASISASMASLLDKPTWLRYSHLGLERARAFDIHEYKQKIVVAIMATKKSMSAMPRLK